MQLDQHIKDARIRKQSGKNLDPYERGLIELSEKLTVYGMIADHRVPDVVPPPGPKGAWKALAEAGESDGYAKAFTEALKAYSAGDIPKFNEGVRGLLARGGEAVPSDVRRTAWESFFNRADPFAQCRFFYLSAFILTCVGWLGWTTAMNRSAFRLGWFIFALHTAALIVRIYLSGRPPVTNLYSSAIFVGWGAVLFGLVLEAFTRGGVGNLIASIAGFITLQIAHVLAAEGDTLEVLQAVLDTQFWLAVHVTTISLGYATTYVAGLLGFIYVIRGLLTTSLDEQTRGSLATMIHGTTCFAMFFSFFGTVLGGLWADDSWGRFWGWDPKENGALMIVLWNALMLHARWGGLVRERGLAVLAILGSLIVSWSWFGVNELSKGLHTYGFTEGREGWLWVTFWIHLVLINAGAFVPRRFWRSPDAVRPPKTPEPA
jgi:ABC-type transport system involved in cytochrome c biogenesis permease subunit